MVGSMGRRLTPCLTLSLRMIAFDKIGETARCEDCLLRLLGIPNDYVLDIVPIDWVQRPVINQVTSPT